VLRANIGGKQYTSGLEHNRDILARMRANALGLFRFEKIPIPPRLDEVINDLGAGRPGAQLLAWREGSGLAWTEVRGLRVEGDVRITLAPEAVVNGSVRSANGNPVAGALVEVLGATRATASYDGFLRQPGDLNFSLSELSFDSQVNAAGWFSLRNLPKDYRILVACRWHGYARQSFIVDTGDSGVASQIQNTNAIQQVTTVKRSPLDIELLPASFVTVKVLDHDGQPVKAGNIEVISPERYFAGRGPVGADGVARIALTKPRAKEFHYGSDPLDPKLETATITEVSADETAEVVIKLRRPRWLSVRVVDADSGKPVVGAYIRYVAAAGAESGHSLGVSGGDGSLRLPVAAGKGRLHFGLPVHGYLAQVPTATNDRHDRNTAVEINIPETGEIEPVEMRLARGLVVRGIVLDEAGQPLAQARVRGETGFLKFSARTDERGKFELAGLSPFSEARLIVAHPSGAAQETIAGEPEHDWGKTRKVDVELKTKKGVTLTGRVLKDGQPESGVRVRLHRNSPANPNQFYVFDEQLTDADGRYAFVGLSPGDRYNIELETDDGSTAPDWRHQMPYISSVPRSARDTVELAGAELISRGQSLRGVVVDRDGKPVAGLTVSPRLADGGRLSVRTRGEGPRETDAEGRFALQNLPTKPIELMVWKRNPQGGRIRYPAIVRPELNQQDIRVIYDATLATELEDLDAATPGSDIDRR
jgi:protocatechuate 3,4-dioxygenase beta subunit